MPGLRELNNPPNQLDDAGADEKLAGKRLASPNSVTAGAGANADASPGSNE